MSRQLSSQPMPYNLHDALHTLLIPLRSFTDELDMDDHGDVAVVMDALLRDAEVRINRLADKVEAHGYVVEFMMDPGRGDCTHVSITPQGEGARASVVPLYGGMGR